MFLGIDLTLLVATYGLWAVALFVAIESMGVPVPGETMLLVAAVYAGATHQLSIVAVIAAAVVAAIAGDNLGYLLGRLGGERLLRRVGPVLHLTEGRLAIARYLFQKHGGKAVFFGRFVAVLRVTAAWVAGISRMRWWRFLAWNAAGGIVWATTVGLISYYLGTAAASAFSKYGLYAAGGALLFSALGFLIVRRIEKRVGAEDEDKEKGATGEP